MAAAGIDGPDLSKVAAALLAAEPEIKKALRTALRESAKPILNAERQAVRGLTFSTTKVERSRVLRRKTENTTQGSGRTGGSAAARRASAKATQNLAEAVATGKRLKTAKQWTALKKRSGLRESIARGMRVTYSDRAGEVSVAVKTTASTMPAGQRNLPRLVNAGRWRHPVFPKGTDRKKWTWVYQTPGRVGWWWQTAQGEIPAATVRVGASLDQIAAQIAAATQRAGQA